MAFQNHVRTRGPTPQTQPMIGREADQAKNDAGGFVFQLDRWAQLRRFLILGTEGGTYYASEEKATKRAAKAVLECISEDGVRVVREIVEISQDGRAPKQDYGIFALALVLSVGTPDAKAAAVDAVPAVLRTATTLFQFLDYLKGQRGRGSAFKRAIRRWYLSRDAEQLAYQVVKYGSRHGFTHRDAMLLGHVKPTAALQAVMAYAAGKDYNTLEVPALPELVHAVEAVKSQRELIGIPGIVARIASNRIPREALPTELLNDRNVWLALLGDMPMHALVRNLGVMSAKGVLSMNDQGTVQTVVAKLTNGEYLRKSRMHPIAVALAARTYTQGHGEKGKLKWTPVPPVIDALEDAFERSFANVTPTGKRFLMAIDGSGSMGSPTSGAPLFSCREAAVLMSLAGVRSEPWCQVVGFSHSAWDVPITKRMGMHDAVSTFNRKIDPTSTDCAAPIQLALQKGWQVDVFVLYTDNETWAGSQHPQEALEEYRRKTGINAKMVVAAMTATPSSIGDPKDPNVLNLVGFDSSAPQLIAAFARGDL